METIIDQIIRAGDLAIKITAQSDNGIPTPQNLRVVSEVGFITTYQWDAATGNDGFQFKIEDERGVIIDTISAPAGSTTYAWNHEFVYRAIDFRFRYTNTWGQEADFVEMTEDEFYGWIKRFKRLQDDNHDANHVDHAPSEMCISHTNAYMARTSLYGNYKASLSGGLLNSDWIQGQGFKQGAGKNLVWDYNPAIHHNKFSLNNCGVYGRLTGQDTSVSGGIMGGYNSPTVQVYLITSGDSVYNALNGGDLHIPVLKQFDLYSFTNNGTHTVTQLDEFEDVSAYVPNDYFNGTIPEAARVPGGLNAPANSVGGFLWMGDNTMSKDIIHAALTAIL